jgi:transcriptional regulator
MDWGLLKHALCVHIGIKRDLPSLALTEREKQILRLKKGDLSDYEIARKLRVDARKVTCTRLSALRKIERTQADLDFAHE